ncbi:PAQR family membrane homeostasis protein TrhA [Tamlana sp. I1]|uniref:PAQR family membrane homeostasis protein TrhA n=1 Tax=Tamlana sp. I1 TaxID=2762061 RepID=UPI00188F074D|nr:hemolysin III family protein [Tamlana sp. I1]
MVEQTPFEEKLNAFSHALGVVFGIVALVLLIQHDSGKSDWSLFSVIVYGLSIIILFSASTLYHSIKYGPWKQFFRIIDHICIYLLIAGTYTPVTLIALHQSLGWPLFYTVWGIAFVGMILKLFFTGRFEVISTLLYVVMGWLIIFDISNLSQSIGSDGIWLLCAGGLCYMFGIIFYAVQKIPYHHLIWHLFVLAGAICHFLMIFYYVI